MRDPHLVTGRFRVRVTVGEPTDSGGLGVPEHPAVGKAEGVLDERGHADEVSRLVPVGLPCVDAGCRDAELCGELPLSQARFAADLAHPVAE